MRTPGVPLAMVSLAALLFAATIALPALAPGNGGGNPHDNDPAMAPAPGEVLSNTSPEAVAVLDPLPGVICFVDDDGSATYNPGEGVYFTTQPDCTGSAGGNDLRLVPSAGQAFGTKVRATHSDFGNPYTAFDVSVSSYDADGDLVWSLGDTAYLDADSDGAVSVGDVRLTAVGGFAAGSVVAAGNAEINNALSLMVNGQPTAWASWDSDGDQAYTAPDVVYIDATSRGFATPGSIRLTSLSG